MVAKENLRLGKQDWINFGLKVLAESGVEAVRVEPLAKRLGVTKGSFYWHFQNRDALLEALLQEWMNRETSSILEQVEKTGGDANTKLLHLFELAIENDSKLENAVRAWGWGDIKAANVVAQIDKKRLNYTQNLFLQLGFTPFEALVRARTAYYALVGEFTVGIQIHQNERLKEARIQHAFLVRRD